MRKVNSNDFFLGEWKEVFGKLKWKNIFLPTDISSIVFFRIFFGIIMLWEVIRYFNYRWISDYWIEPKHHFTYDFFRFLEPLPADGMYYLFAFLAFLAVFISIGFLYRISITLFFIAFTYVFLLEETRYLNHFYLISIVSFLLIFIPCHRSFSIDSKIFKNIHRESTPLWTVWILRFSIGIVYFFGGIAKINEDWLSGNPMRMWIYNKTDFPIIGSFFREEWMVYFFSYTGLILDLSIVPLLVFKSSRKIGLALIFVFCFINSQMFKIGIFPWFMLISTSLFFQSDWFRSTYNKLVAKWSKEESFKISSLNVLNKKHKIIMSALILFCSLEILVPLRHHLYEGNVNWNEKGHRFSWRMKLRSKKGKGYFIVKDKKNNKKLKIKTNDYLTKWQKRKMRTHPDMIWKFAQIIKEDYKKKGFDVEVYAKIKVSLNGRKYQRFVKPKLDITSLSLSEFERIGILRMKN